MGPFLDWLLPERCPLCDGCATIAGFCAACHDGLPRQGRPAAAGGPGISGPLGTVRAPFRLAFPMRELIHRFKYRGQRQLARPLGLLLAEALAARPLTADLLVPMPLHRARLIERGYNQSFELTRTLRRETGLPIRLRGISRIRATLPQTELAPADRRANVKDAFRVSRRLEGVRILVVDDVITTGATARELARVLLAGGARSVSLIAVAHGQGVNR